jgi:hypothetical protein
VAEADELLGGCVGSGCLLLLSAADSGQWYCRSEHRSFNDQSLH